MNQSSKDLVRKIAQLRRSNGIKPEEMALVLEISGEQYKKLERGTREITLSQVFRIAEIFKIQAGSLFDESEGMAHVNIPPGITEINFTITVKSQDPIDIHSEIAKKFGLSRPSPKEEIIEKHGLSRRRW
jgi:transcriptional regulator with XRE-family HTH domain